MAISESGVGIEVREERVPVTSDVKGTGEMLGLDPFQIANEGVAVLGVAPTAAEDVLAALREHPKGTTAAHTRSRRPSGCSGGRRRARGATRPTTRSPSRRCSRSEQAGAEEEETQIDRIALTSVRVAMAVAAPSHVRSTKWM